MVSAFVAVWCHMILRRVHVDTKHRWDPHQKLYAPLPFGEGTK